jgi:hypothetical protein
VNGESRPKAAPADSRSEVESQSSEEERQSAGVLTALQRSRYSSMTVDGILAVSEPTVKAFHLASSLGKGMRKDGTFAPLRDPDDLLAVAVWEIHRDRVIGLLGLSSQAWRRYVRQWETVGMAHRCRHLTRGRVFLFLSPETICPVCGEAFTTRRVERSSDERSAFMARTQNVFRTGDASRDEEGVSHQVGTIVPGKEASETSQEGLSESAPPSNEEALASLKRVLGATPRLETGEIGDPLTDDEIRELGYEPTRRGWVPRKAASDAA